MDIKTKAPQQETVADADVSALFGDPDQKAQLETFLKEKAGVADDGAERDTMDTAFF